MSPTCQELDINECGDSQFTANNTCAPLTSICINTYGSYLCGCQLGFYGDGTTCLANVYKVYTTIELPELTSAAFSLSPAVQQQYETELSVAFGTVLAAGISPDPTFKWDKTAMAINFTEVTPDWNYKSTTRLYINTFFKDLATAQQAINAVNLTQLAVSLSRALIPPSSNDTGYVRLLQHLDVTQYSATQFGSPISMTSWGVVVSSVNFNRSCITLGKLPQWGCWEIEMTYNGGAADNSGGPAQGREGMNILYLPNVARDPSASYTFASTLGSMQQDILTAQGSFPCQQATGAVQRSGTACCIRDVESNYLVGAGLAGFVQTADFATNVPLSVCNQNTFSDSIPNSDIIWNTGNYNEGTNDYVVGAITGLDWTEVKLLEVIDYTNRIFRIKLSLSEQDLLAYCATSFVGSQATEYTASFYVAMANFRGTGGSALMVQTMVQPITVSKTNVLTLSSYGADQDPLIASTSLVLHRVTISNLNDPVKYMYWLEAVFTIPSQYVGLGYGHSSVPLNGIVVGKSLHGAEPTSWVPVCASSDGSDMWSDANLQADLDTAYNEPCAFQNSNAQMCQTPQATLPNVVDLGLPLTPTFVQDADFSEAGSTSLMVKIVVSAKAQSGSNNQVISTAIAMSVKLVQGQFDTECMAEIKQAQNLADVVNGSIYVGFATNAQDWGSSIQQKVNTAVPNATFNAGAALNMNSVTVQGAFITLTATGADWYFKDPRATTFNLSIYDIHTVHFLEPLGGKGGGSPKFDTVVGLLNSNQAYTMANNKEYSWLEPNAQLTTLCPQTMNSGSITCMYRPDSTIRNGVLSKGPSVALLRHNDTTSKAEVQAMLAKNLMAGNPNAYTLEAGGEFYDVLSQQLTFDDRYRRAYLVNPVFDWSNQHIQGAQPGATTYTVCTKIVVTALITLQTNTGVLTRRLLTTMVDNDWSTPILHKQAALAMHQPASLRASRHLLSSGAGSGTQPQSLTASGATTTIAINIPGVTGASTLCRQVLNVDVSQCAFFGMAVTIPVEKAAAYCNAANNALGSTLQAQTDQFLSSSSTGYTHSVLVDYTLNGCPNSNSPAANRRLLQTAYAGTVILEQTVMVGTQSSMLGMDTAAIQQALLGMGLVTFTSVVGGGAQIVWITIHKNGTTTIGNSSNTTFIVDIAVRNTTANTSVTNIQGLGSLMFVDDMPPPPAKSSAATLRTCILLTNCLAAMSLLLTLSTL